VKVLNYCTPSVGAYITGGFIVESVHSAVTVFKWQYRESIINAVTAAATQTSHAGGGSVRSNQFALGVRSLYYC
jgi:hypothetical protein